MATHLVLSTDRGQVDTKGLHFSDGGGGYQGVTGNRETHFREINQSLDEQDCHFLYEC